MTIKVFIQKVKNRLILEIRDTYLNIMTRFVYNRRKSYGRMRTEHECDFCDLVVVAFNNAKVIDYQIRTLKKHFTYPYRYTVFDNSNDDEKAELINAICQKNDTAYIRLPKQEFMPKGYASYSHAIACNYIIDNYIQKSGAKYFGLLDHDIFPVTAFDVSKFLEQQPLYGIRHRFYLWPGLFFVRMDYLKERKADFRPSFNLKGDTGARNIYSLLKEIKFDELNLVNEEKICFEGYDDIFQYGYSYFDCGWIHCWNASNYMGKSDMAFKMNMIYKMLDEKLK